MTFSNPGLAHGYCVQINQILLHSFCCLLVRKKMLLSPWVLAL